MVAVGQQLEPFYYSVVKFYGVNMNTCPANPDSITFCNQRVETKFLCEETAEWPDKRFLQPAPSDTRVWCLQN